MFIAFFILIAIFLIIGLFLILLLMRYKKQLDAKEQEQKAIKAREEKAVEVYEKEQKKNEEIINNINPDNALNILHNLAKKGQERNSK